MRSLPVQPNSQLVVVTGNHQLMVGSLDLIAIFEMPFAPSGRLIIFELPLVIISIWEDPSTLDELILVPVTLVSHASFIEDISSFTMFLSVLPESRIDVLIRICVESFALFLSLMELS